MVELVKVKVSSQINQTSYSGQKKSTVRNSEHIKYRVQIQNCVKSQPGYSISKCKSNPRSAQPDGRLCNTISKDHSV